MVSVQRALLLLTFAVATMAITPALSQPSNVGLPGFPLTSPLECWKIVGDVEGCMEQLLTSITALNPNFSPACCKAIVGIPLNCAQWIFPLGLSFGDKVSKFCTNLPGAAAPPPAS